MIITTVNMILGLPLRVYCTTQGGIRPAAKKEEKKRIIAKVLQTKSVVWRLLLIQGCFNRQAPSVRAAFQCSLSQDGSRTLWCNTFQELISLIKVFLFFGLESTFLCWLIIHAPFYLFIFIRFISTFIFRFKAHRLLTTPLITGSLNKIHNISLWT